MTDRDQDYLFDLQGYFVLRGALSPDQLSRINAWVDDHTPEKTGQWFDRVHVHSYQGHDGFNFQNIVSAGGVFAECVNHEAWMPSVRRYITTDMHKPSVQENFLNVRGQSGFIGIHSGGHNPGFVMSTRHHTGAWMLGQINILMALTDIGPGDGATTVVPGSHKSHEVHPALLAEGDRGGAAQSHNDDIVAGEQLGMTEVHLKAGDALMFTDAICHGSAARTNGGQRRVMIYRYSPHVIAPRFNYEQDPDFLDTLTPARRELLNPHPTLRP